MKNIFTLILFSVLNGLSIAQYRPNVDIYNVDYIEKNLFDEYFDFSTIDKQFTADELVDKTISNNEVNFYFINNKYYVKIDVNNKKNTIGEYLFKVINEVPVIILKEGSDFDVVVKTPKNDFEIYYGGYNTIFKKVKNQHHDELIIDCVEIDKSNSNLKLINNKLNIELGNVWKPIDSIRSGDPFNTIYKDGKATIYNDDLTVLLSNCKVAYDYQYYQQVIDENNHMFFLDIIGNKLINKPKRTYGTGCGYVSPDTWYTTYYKHKNKILCVENRNYNLNDDDSGNPFSSDLKEQNKFTKYCIDDYLHRNSNGEYKISFKDIEQEIEWYIDRNNDDELLFLKKLYKKEKYVEELSYVLFSEEYKQYFINLPFKMSKTRFIYGDTKKYTFSESYKEGFYTQLKNSYLIGKKSDKYGVWDIQTKKTIVPFIYKKIEIKPEYLVLKRKKLVGYYPITGIAKYKFLGEFIENFARFEYHNGKSGWIDRNGTEFYD